MYSTMRQRLESRRKYCKNIDNYLKYTLMAFGAFLLTVFVLRNIYSTSSPPNYPPIPDAIPSSSDSSSSFSTSSFDPMEALHERFEQRLIDLFVHRFTHKRPPSDYDVAKLLSDVYSEENEEINFVQVGACDGETSSTNDPVQRLVNTQGHWHGVMMEPVPELFKKLSKNVLRLSANPMKRIHLINAALAELDGTKPFYVVNDKFRDEKPGETHALKYQIGSFDINHIRKHFVKLKRRNELKLEVDDYIDTIQVQAATPKRVVKEFRKSGKAVRDGTIDVLLIDAEGFDYQVLKMFVDMDDIRPPVVVYEILHMPPATQEKAKTLLSQLGYAVWNSGWNAVAVRMSHIPFSKIKKMAANSRDTKSNAAGDESGGINLETS